MGRVFLVCGTLIAAIACANTSTDNPINASHFSSSSIARGDLSVRSLPESAIAAGLSCRMCLEKFDSTHGQALSLPELRQIAAKSADRNVSLFASFLEISRLYQNNALTELLNRLDAVKALHSVEYKYARLTTLDEHTYFSDQTLQNLLGLFEYMARLDLPGGFEDRVSVAISYLSHRNAFLPVIELLDVPLDDMMLSVLRDIDPTNYQQLNKVWAIWEEGRFRYVTVRNGDEVHTVRIANDGATELVSGRSGSREFQELRRGDRPARPKGNKFRRRTPNAGHSRVQTQRVQRTA